MKVSLEDELEDILNKALMGQLAEGNPDLVNISEKIRSEFGDAPPLEMAEEEILELGTLVGLNVAPLLDIARDPRIEEIVLPDNLHAIVMPFGPYTVNVYALSDSKKKDCVLFDAGTRADEVLTFLESTGFTPQSLFITHSHRDHIAGIDAIRNRYPDILIYAKTPELLSGAVKVKELDVIPFRDYSIQVFETLGHSKDAVSYLIRGDSTQAMVVGDALFARSIGKIHTDYKSSLETIRTKILCQAPDTLLLPGHGPVTTVGDERKYNPFFP